MKKILSALLGIFFMATGTAHAAPYTPFQGGTGTNSIPTYGNVLVGNGLGIYTPMATSSLGIVSTLLGTTGQLGYFSGTNTLAGTSTIFITPSGQVGIGTTTPGTLLDVSGVDATTYAATAASLARVGVTNRDTTTNNFADFSIKTADSAGATISGIRLMGIFTSHVAGAVAADLAFVTRNAGTLTEWMRLTSTGNFGIGTTSPYSKLSVAGQVVAKNYVATSTTATSTFAGPVQIGAQATNANYPLLTIGTSTETSANDALFVNSGTGADAQIFFQNYSSGVGAYINAKANSHYVSFEMIGGNGDGGVTSDWKFGNFGSNNFNLFDGTNSKTPFVVEANSPTNLLYLAATGRVGIGSSTPGTLFSIGGNGTGTNFVDNATTTKSGVGGINIAQGCFAVGGTCIGGSTYSATYPVTLTGSAFGLAFGTTTTNAWNGLQTFNGGITTAGTVTLGSLTGALSAASGVVSAGTLSVANGGTNATSFTTSGNGVYWNGSSLATAPLTSAVTYPYASSTAVTVSGTTYTGTIAVGTSTPYSKLSVWGANTTSGVRALEVTNSASTTEFYVDNAGNSFTRGLVGINVPISQLQSDTQTMGIQSPANTQNIVSLIRPTNTVSNFIQFQPNGGNSSTNVNWIMGVNGNSDNFAFAYWNGSQTLTKMTIVDTTGNVGIGTTTPAYLFNVAAASAPQLGLSDGTGTSNPWTLRSIAGSFYLATSSPSTFATSSVSSFSINKNGVVSLGNYADCSGTSNALGITSGQILCDSLVSDQRLKKDITPIAGGLSTVMALKPVSFYWKDLTNHNTTDPREQDGFIAQDVQKILPSAVGESPDGYLTLDKTALISPIVAAIQAQQKEIEALGGSTKKAVTDNWQDVFIAFLLAYVIYNEWDKRRKK